MAVLRKSFLCFTAGAIGGLANSLAVWLAGAIGLTALCGVAIHPALTPPWLYPRIVWGGLWGLLFIPLTPGRRLLRYGLLLSLAPTLVQLFVVFPFKAHAGWLGLSLGGATPLFVVLFNAVWGVVSAAALMAADGPGPSVS